MSDWAGLLIAALGVAGLVWQRIAEVKSLPPYVDPTSAHPDRGVDRYHAFADPADR